MKITYIHHSSFCVEFENVILLFDYFQGKLPEFDKNKKIYVFASHKHPDHFDRKIFDLSLDYPNIKYILSSDIRMSASYMDKLQISELVRENIIYIGKNTELDLSDIWIKTLTSTDQGVAFLVTCNDKVIYHAGDLNWWTWKGETDQEYKDMTTRFMNEMKKLKGETIDVAFVPLDPRQEERFWWGFHEFMKVTETKTVFPMHFWMDYSIIDKFKQMEESKEYADRIMDITVEGQEFIV